MSRTALPGPGAIAVAAFALMSATAAHATVTFCNKFEHTIFVAIAYPQGGDRWLSRGWLELTPGDCAPFDNALRLQTLYYRAESESYRTPEGRRKYEWGKSRAFAIWEDDNFNYWDAQGQVLKSTMAMFSQGPNTDADDLDVTITFQEGSVTTSFRGNGPDDQGN